MILNYRENRPHKSFVFLIDGWNLFTYQNVLCFLPTIMPPTHILQMFTWLKSQLIMLWTLFHQRPLISSPDQCGSVGWVLFHKAKGHQFNSQLEHMSGFQVQTWGCKWQATHQCFSLTLMFLFHSFSLLSPSLKINK